jgi:hypothetical protein
MVVLLYLWFCLYTLCCRCSMTAFLSLTNECHMQAVIGDEESCKNRIKYSKNKR